MGEGERQYLKVPKDDAEMMMNKLVSAGLLDEESEVKWEGEFVSFPLKEGLVTVSYTHLTLPTKA